VLARLQSGDVASLLDSLIASRLPDPAARQQFVRQFIDKRGLPEVLGSPIAIYARRVYLEERWSTTTGLVGARNTIFLTGYRLRTEPIAGVEADLPALASTLDNSTQLGATAVWTHKLTPLLSLVTRGDWRYTRANAPLTGAAREMAFNVLLSRPLSPYTLVNGGVRYQRLRSDLTNDYDETAVFVGISHLFH
jgi:uncharacterized protein (PEP-CTERM system associated)